MLTKNQAKNILCAREHVLVKLVYRSNNNKNPVENIILKNKKLSPLRFYYLELELPDRMNKLNGYTINYNLIIYNFPKGLSFLLF